MNPTPTERIRTSPCRTADKPTLYAPWPLDFVPVHARMSIAEQFAREFRVWLDQARKPDQPLILNVAGNRERLNPGIQEAIRGFLNTALRQSQ